MVKQNAATQGHDYSATTAMAPLPSGCGRALQRHVAANAPVRTYKPKAVPLDLEQSKIGNCRTTAQLPRSRHVSLNVAP
jgi:hypothetical protein